MEYTYEEENPQKSLIHCPHHGGNYAGLFGWVDSSGTIKNVGIGSGSHVLCASSNRADVRSETKLY